MHTKVAILGGGLAGLHAAHLLHLHGIDFRLVEARHRLGGRILSTDENNVDSEDGFDLGPSWFWPNRQPELARLVQSLGVSVFAQHNEGDVLFERMSRETPWRYRATYQEPQSLRMVGGTSALIRALAHGVSDGSILRNTRVESMALQLAGVHMLLHQADGTTTELTADQVIAAVPPRLLAQVPLDPALD